MVIIYFTEKGMVTSTHSIKNPERKDLKTLVSAFENLRKNERSYYFGFENVNFREQAVWKMADDLARLKVYQTALEQSNLLLKSMLYSQSVKQLPCFLPGSRARCFARKIKKLECRVEILNNGGMEIFDGEKVEIVPTSNKKINDMLKNK